MKIHLVMPMAGAGSRFYKNGYMLPKPLMEINGHPFLYWATESVRRHVECVDITFVVLKKHVDENKIDEVILKYYPEAKIRQVPEVLPGATMTCLEGVAEIEDDIPILFNDCDHMFKCEEFNAKMKGADEISYDGALLTFFADEPQYSFVLTDDTGRVTGTVEKKVVSNNAICGAYFFKSANVFRRATKDYMGACEYPEYFLSGVYNILCKNKGDIRIFKCNYHVNFGTPEEYEAAKDAPEFEDYK